MSQLAGTCYLKRELIRVQGGLQQIVLMPLLHRHANKPSKIGKRFKLPQQLQVSRYYLQKYNLGDRVRKVEPLSGEWRRGRVQEVGKAPLRISQ